MDFAMQLTPMTAEQNAKAGTGQAAERDLLVDVDGLKVHFFTNEGVVKAVDGVSFQIVRGKTLCVVGESGSGKSVTGRAILNQVTRPGRIVEGAIRYYPKRGQPPADLAKLDPKGRAIRAIRGRDVGLISQEPMAALSPVHTIGNQMLEAINLHFKIGKAEAYERAIDMLAKVGIPRPADRMKNYAFEFSGGMRQRVCIALALVCNPKLLIADEPTTALDVTTQATILDLIANLQEQLGISVLFITHDLGVVAEIADEVVVMYLGQVVEQADAETIYHAPKHPYTEALLKSIPRFSETKAARLDAIAGMVPSPFDRPTGCGFHPRCVKAIAGVCDRITPWPEYFGDGQFARCHLHSSAERIEQALEGAA
jgi:peptide/nickel transport system ATP-binding protein